MLLGGKPWLRLSVNMARRVSFEAFELRVFGKVVGKGCDKVVRELQLEACLVNEDIVGGVAVIKCKHVGLCGEVE